MMNGEKIRSPTVAKREHLVQQMVDVLGDEHSLGFYRKVATTVPEQRVSGALSQTRLASREGMIRDGAGKFFAGLVSRWLSF